jgi:high frequency lysogenization protein
MTADRSEERTLALAGLFQALALVRTLATQGQAEAASYASSIGSVLRIDAPSVAAVFDGVGGVRLGLQTLQRELEGQQVDAATRRMALTVLRIERRLIGDPPRVEHLQQGLRDAQRQAEHFGSVDHPTVIARLAGLYADTLSSLRPRVLVTGNAQMLNQQVTVERIRAALLAAVRAAVLWRQLGGTQWRLLLQRRQTLMVARGLLTRATLDQG